MQVWETALLTASLSILTAIITTKVTAWSSHKNEVKKWLLEKRTEVYLDLYEKTEIVLRNRKEVFSREYLKMLADVKPAVKLFGSKEVVDALYNYFEYIKRTSDAFEAFCRENDPERNDDNYEYGIDEYGEEYEIPHFTEFDIKRFDDQVREYKKTYKPDIDEVRKYINSLNKAMRKDLGSDWKVGS